MHRGFRSRRVCFPEGFIVQPEDYVEDKPVDPVPPTPAPTPVRCRKQWKIYGIILIMYI